MAFEYRLLITDLDNTLWDWVSAWHRSFSALLAGVSELSGISQSQLESEIRPIHQARGTTEYSNLLEEIPSLVKYSAPLRPYEVFSEPLHRFRSLRRTATLLYPGVREALLLLKDAGVRVVAYTESGAYWTGWRIRHTGLDGVIDVLYSAEDHPLPDGMTVQDLRTGHQPPEAYSFETTVHHHTPAGELKPSRRILESILADQGVLPREAVYLGDSLMKDVAMAQSAGVMDVHAKYGEAQTKPEYELLRRVSHWPDEDVQKEQAIVQRPTIRPTNVCEYGFSQILPLFGLTD